MHGLGSHSFISTKIRMLLSFKRTQYMQHVIFLNNPTFYDQIIMPINECTSIQLQEELS